MSFILIRELQSFSSGFGLKNGIVKLVTSRGRRRSAVQLSSVFRLLATVGEPVGGPANYLAVAFVIPTDPFDYYVIYIRWVANLSRPIASNSGGEIVLLYCDKVHCEIDGVGNVSGSGAFKLISIHKSCDWKLILNWTDYFPLFKCRPLDGYSWLPTERFSLHSRSTKMFACKVWLPRSTRCSIWAWSSRCSARTTSRARCERTPARTLVHWRRTSSASNWSSTKVNVYLFWS